MCQASIADSWYRSITNWHYAFESWLVFQDARQLHQLTRSALPALQSHISGRTSAPSVLDTVRKNVEKNSA